MNAHVIHILAWISFLLLKLNTAESNEPSCLSRFDYDMKMFETVADMKHTQKTVQTTINRLQDLVEKLTTTVSGHEQTRLDINKRLDNIDAVIRKQQSTSETTFVRWGRNSCPENGTSLLYKGIVGGALYSQSGSGSNHLCLPEDPTWGRYHDGTQGNKGYMYGSEYEPESFFPDSLWLKEVPCSVCLSPRPTILMIPAKTTCHPGWSLEYEGILASSHHGQHRTQYICVDKDPEITSKNNSANQDGVLFYAVESRCGSLPCPPYVEGRELACVVCTK